MSDKTSISSQSVTSGSSGNNVKCSNITRRHNSVNQCGQTDSLLLVDDKFTRRFSGQRQKQTAQNERSNPLTGLIRKIYCKRIKLNNFMYRQNTIQTIKEKHNVIQTTGTRSSKLSNCTENVENMNIQLKPEPIKSFYV